MVLTLYKRGILRHNPQRRIYYANIRRFAPRSSFIGRFIIQKAEVDMKTVKEAIDGHPVQKVKVMSKSSQKSEKQ